MNNFIFHNPMRIFFGKGTDDQVGKLTKQFGGSRVLLHYGTGSIKKSGLYDKVVKQLKNEGLFVLELGGVVPNPRLSLIREGIRLCKEHKIDFILAVGGGSVIDSAKGIAAGAVNEKEIWDYYMDWNNVITSALPLGVVLTLPATGSEASLGTVVTEDETGLKRYFSNELLVPKFSIMNPELTYTMPKYQIGCGCADILAHLMERYFTQTEHVDFTDRLLEGSMRTILNYAPMAMKDPTNYDVRAEIMWVGTLAHCGLLGTGRLEDWASHDIEHELAGIYDIAHGAGLAIMFPAWMKYVYHANKKRFVQFAVRVFDVDLAFEDEDAIILEAISRLEAWFKTLELPTRLSEIDIDDSRFEEMSQKAMLGGRTHLGEFIQLSPAMIKEILTLAL